MLSKITDMKMCSVSPTTKLVVRCQLHYTCTSICIVTCKNIINWLMINSLAVYFYFVVFCFLLSEFSLDENAFLGRLFVFTFRNIWKTLVVSAFLVSLRCPRALEHWWTLKYSLICQLYPSCVFFGLIVHTHWRHKLYEHICPFKSFGYVLQKLLRQVSCGIFDVHSL